MRVEISPRLFPKRGGAVAIGNVYANNRPPAFKTYRIVVGLMNQTRNYNDTICIHVDGTGGVVGCSANPSNYVRDHWDLIGRVKEMPTLKIEWITLEQMEEEASVDQTG
jgi:hypothetical protein